MAANKETSFAERNRGWYQEDLTEVNEPVRKLLENYSKVPSEDVVKHVNKIVITQILHKCFIGRTDQ